MKKRFPIVKKVYLWLALAAILLVGSWATFLLNAHFSEEFTGGVNVSILGNADPSTLQTDLSNYLEDEGFKSIEVFVEPAATETKIKINADLENDEVVTTLSKDIQGFLLENEYITSIDQIIGQTITGPSVGDYMKTTALWALVWGIVFMVIYMFISFFEVRKYISPAILATVVVVTMLIDISIPAGAFGLWMMFDNTIQINSVFILAVLTVIGYGINDVIIIFDRIRENMIKTGGKKEAIYGKVFEESIWQTMRRSVGTSLSVVLIVVAMFIFGTGVIQEFAFTVGVGIIAATFSSIFVAAPLAYLLTGKMKSEKDKF